MHRGGVQRQCALDAARAGFAHAAPVAVAFAHQAPGGDGGDGLVPVLHLDGMQRHVHHLAVGAHLRHLDPVAGAQHVVAGELHAGREGQDGVLEHQHQHGRQRTQTREQQQRRAVGEFGRHDDQAAQHHHQLGELDVALDGQLLAWRMPQEHGLVLERGIEVGQDHPDDAQHHIGREQGVEDDGGQPVWLGQAEQAELHQQGRDDTCRAAQHGTVQQDVEPGRAVGAQHALAQLQQAKFEEDAQHPGREEEQRDDAGHAGRGRPVGREPVQRVAHGAAQRIPHLVGQGRHQSGVGVGAGPKAGRPPRWHKHAGQLIMEVCKAHDLALRMLFEL